MTREGRASSGALVVAFALTLLALPPETGEKACRTRVPTIAGTNGPDVLRGTNGPDVILGLGGDDTIHARGGKDIVCAGKGIDDVHGGAGNDFILGADDRDVLRGGADDDRIFGGGADEELHGGTGDDLMDGQQSPDSVSYSWARGPIVVQMAVVDDEWAGPADGQGSDMLRSILRVTGSPGDDEIAAWDARAGGGDDRVSAYEGRGGPGNDELMDLEYLNSFGSFALFGGSGDDTIVTHDRAIDLIGGAGNDQLVGAGPVDFADGGSGTDQCIAKYERHCEDLSSRPGVNVRPG